MNRGLVLKALREVVLPTILCGMGLLTFEAIVSFVFWTYQKELTEDLLQIEFVRNLIQSLVGGDFDSPLGPDSLKSLAWVHPLVLAIVFAHAIVVCTRVPSGEVDRGTADFLFTLPVSRWGIFRVEVALCFLCGAAVIGLGVIGSAIGYQAVPPEGRPDAGRMCWVITNLYLLVMTVAGMTTLFSTLTDRRGKAFGWSFGVVLFLLMWNFLAQYYEPVDRILFLNLLAYYRPLPILNDGAAPWRDMAVLLSCLVPFWLGAGIVLSRRDICTT